MEEKRTVSLASSGQIVVEYVLLLSIAVALAILITNLMVSRNPTNPGFLVSKWEQIINLIGSDIPDDPASP